MKHLIKPLLIIAVIALITTSCRKGEDDPFLSFRSRKARITGEWVLKSGNSSNYTYDGNYKYSQTDTTPYKEKWIFNKNGEFELFFYNDLGTSANHLMEGTWSFGNKDKAKDYKNKETIILRVTRDSTGGYFGIYDMTFSGTAGPVHSYTISQLKNKSMTIKFDGTSNIDGSINTSHGSMTYEKQ